MYFLKKVFIFWGEMREKFSSSPIINPLQKAKIICSSVNDRESGIPNALANGERAGSSTTLIKKPTRRGAASVGPTIKPNAHVLGHMLV